MDTRRLAGARLTRPRPRWTAIPWTEREATLGWLLSLPALLILLVFIAYPFLVGIWLSVSDETVARAGHFVGLANFLNQLSSQIFRATVRNTLVYTAATLVLKTAFGLALALVMNQNFPAKNLARAILLLPWIAPTALSTIAWRWLFDPTYSTINWALVQSGLAPLIAHTFIGHALALSPRGVNWLGNGSWAMVSIILVNAWRGVPFFAISILAALQTISHELYEAAALDGAGGWQRFRYVTLPLVRPVLLVVLLFSLVWTISDFQLVYVLTGGGPANSTHLFSTLAYQIALRSGQLGQGASVSLFMFPFLLVTVAGLLWYLRRQEV